VCVCVCVCVCDYVCYASNTSVRSLPTMISSDKGTWGFWRPAKFRI